MNIGIDIRSIGRRQTGNETYTKEIVKNILRIDSVDRFYLYTDTDEPGEIKEIKDSLQITDELNNVEIITVLPASKALWTFYCLPKYIFKHPVDVLFVQYIAPLILPRQTKLVTTVHDISFNFFPQYIKTSDLLFLRTLIPLSIKRADKVIGVSEFTRDEIVRYYKTNPEKVVAIPNAVGESFYAKVSEERISKVKKKYNLPERFMLYVGTLQPRKNVPFMIQGFGRLKEEPQDPQIQSLKLVIVGNQKAHNVDKRIEETINEMKQKNPLIEKDIIFPGFVEQEDLTAVYQAAKVFCLPSLYEGFGIPVVEAMASGVPVVCSNSSCLPEVAADAAMIFDKDSESDFVSKVKAVVQDESLQESLIRKGQQRARSFSWEKAAKETLKTLKEPKMGA